MAQEKQLSVEDLCKELNFGPCEILPFENKSSCNGFEEPLCYFAALLKRRGAVMNEQCGMVSMKKKKKPVDDRQKSF